MDGCGAGLRDSKRRCYGQSPRYDIQTAPDEPASRMIHSDHADAPGGDDLYRYAGDTFTARDYRDDVTIVTVVTAGMDLIFLPRQSR